jgi:hypothetical protein
MLIVVDQVFVRDLLRAVMFFEADVGSGFHVKIDFADAFFEDGVVFVSVMGTASVGGARWGRGHGPRRDRRRRAPPGLQASSSAVSASWASTRRTPGAGRRSGRPAHRVLTRGARVAASAPSRSRSVEDRLSIPAVESKCLQIAAVNLPLTIAVRQVKAFGGRLWSTWMPLSHQPSCEDEAAR